MPYRRLERQIERIEQELALAVPNAHIRRCIGTPAFLNQRGVFVPKDLERENCIIYWLISFGDTDFIGLSIDAAISAAEERIIQKQQAYRHKSL